MEALSFRGFLAYTKQFSGDRERGFCLDASVWNQIRRKHAFPQLTPCVTLNMRMQLQLLFRDLKQPSRVLRVSEFLFVYLSVILQFLVPKEFVKKLKHLAGAILLWLLPPNISLPPSSSSA